MSITTGVDTTAGDPTWVRLDEPEGCGWPRSERERPHDRLPARARSLVPEPVWELSRHPAGLFHRFRTDTEAIHVRWRLADSSPPCPPHMTAIAAGGLDLYGEDADGVERWVGSAGPTGVGSVTEATLVTGLDGTLRDYTLHLPVLAVLDSIEIGISHGAEIHVTGPDHQNPVVYYGTSIVQGIAASRPGMTLPALLRRRLRRPVIGLGFSGKGKMERELAELVSEISCAAYIVDCLPNVDAPLVSERAWTFLQVLRERRPATPVLMIEDRTWANAWLRPDLEWQQRAARDALATVVDKWLATTGDRKLAYLRGADLLGADGDDTVDGSHPSDLGFFRMAEHIAPVVTGLL